MLIILYVFLIFKVLPVFNSESKMSELYDTVNFKLVVQTHIRLGIIINFRCRTSLKVSANAGLTVA